MSSRPSPLTSAASRSSQPSWVTAIGGVATRAPPWLANTVAVSLPHPTPTASSAGVGVEVAKPDPEAVGARGERRGAERAVGKLREHLDADVAHPDDDVDAAVAGDVAEVQRARAVRIRAGGRVQDGRAERAAGQLRQHGELEVDRGIQAVAGRGHDVGEAVARDIADRDRVRLGRDRDGGVRGEAAAGGLGGRHERQGDEGARS